MQVIYYKNELPAIINKSIFLAGPSLRPDQEGISWRKEAIQILEDLKFDGVVFCPENENGKFEEDHDYSKTVEWEELGLNVADAIIFWVPRDMEKLPGLTTNIEFGVWETSGKVFLGYPEDAEKMRYMDYYAEKLSISVTGTLKETLQAAIDFVGEGEERTGGSRMVPLYIWKTPSFKAWYKAQTEAGNRLDDARVLYTFRPKNGKFVFLWILHVDVYIKSEDRHKTNEFVLARTDISSVVMWRRAEPLADSEIVLVREFRSPAATSTGFIRELPGGSAMAKEEPAEVAAEEIHEETGLHLDVSRLKVHAAKQLAGTLSSHKAHAFSVELTTEEVDFLKAQKDVAHGLLEDSEQTYVEVVTLGDILYGDVEIDWSTLGIIMLVTDKL